MNSDGSSAPPSWLAILTKILIENKEKMERRLEDSAMDTPEEARGYDRTLKIHGLWMITPQVKTLARVLKDRQDNTRILDIGTGTARLPIAIAHRNDRCEIHAIDISANMLQVAHKNVTRAGLANRIVLRQADAQNLPFEADLFDIVHCSHMLHHLAGPLPLLNEAYRVTKKNGLLVIRDLIRPASVLITDLFVRTFGIPYTKAMKKLYRDSLLSAFSIQEYERMLVASEIKEFKIRKEFPHFISILARK